MAPADLHPSEGGRRDAGFLNPCFFVQPLTDESACNMQVFYVNSPRSKRVRLPLLKNTCDLHEGQALYIWKGEKEKLVDPMEADTPPKKRVRSKHAA